MNIDEAMGIIEGILFASGDPVSIKDIVKATDLTEEDIMKCVNRLEQIYSKSSHGITISKVGENLRLTTKPEIFPYLEAVFAPKAKAQLSEAALETLAIIMFKQPITRAEIEAIRGVNTEKALVTLQERNLIFEKDRLNVPGRPILYATTDYCMEYFGLESIDDVKKAVENTLKKKE